LWRLERWTLFERGGWGPCGKYITRTGLGDQPGKKKRDTKLNGRSGGGVAHLKTSLKGVHHVAINEYDPARGVTRKSR